jgi:hypothetical protein
LTFNVGTAKRCRYPFRKQDGLILENYIFARFLAIHRGSSRQAELMLLKHVLKPFLLILGHEVSSVYVAPSALVARFEVFPISSFSRT